MKLDARHLKSELLQILKEEGLSPAKLAKKGGINTMSLYNILNERFKTTQVSVGRRIAKAADRDFRIEEDRIYFSRRPQLTDEQWKMLEYLEEVGINDLDRLKEILNIFMNSAGKMDPKIARLVDRLLTLE